MILPRRLPGAATKVVFSSQYFLFIFLPAALAIVFLARRWASLPAIFVVSLVFYFSSAGPRTLILVGIVVINCFGALLLARSSSRIVLPVPILLNLAVLFWFKYAAFLSQNIDLWLGTRLGRLTAHIALPNPATGAFEPGRAFKYRIAPGSQTLGFVLPDYTAGPGVRLDMAGPGKSAALSAIEVGEIERPHLASSIP